MPVIRDSLDPKGSTTIMLYSKNEISAEMRQYKHLHTHDIKNERMQYIAAKVRSEHEAVVLIALMMRATKTKPAQFFFDDKINTVFASCEFGGADPDIIREKFKMVVDAMLGCPSLRYLRKDLVGDPIFIEHNIVVEQNIKTEQKPMTVLHPDEALIGPPEPPKKAFIPDSPSLFKFAQHFPFGGGNMAFDVHDPEITE
jgi:hypothetical protein